MPMEAEQVILARRMCSQSASSLLTLVCGRTAIWQSASTWQLDDFMATRCARKGPSRRQRGHAARESRRHCGCWELRRDARTGQRGVKGRPCSRGSGARKGVNAWDDGDARTRGLSGGVCGGRGRRWGRIEGCGTGADVSVGWPMLLCALQLRDAMTLREGQRARTSAGASQLAAGPSPRASPHSWTLPSFSPLLGPSALQCSLPPTMPLPRQPLLPL